MKLFEQSIFVEDFVRTPHFRESERVTKSESRRECVCRSSAISLSIFTAFVHRRRVIRLQVEFTEDCADLADGRRLRLQNTVE